MRKIKRVFLLAHCDDEIFLLPLLLENNSENTLIFFTTMQTVDKSLGALDVRRAEALRANNFMNKFHQVKTLFLDSEVFDGNIFRDFSKLDFDRLVHMIYLEKPDELITLSYEAGHQDHDSVEIITRILANKFNYRMRSFSGYRAARFLPNLFTVLKPFNKFQKIHFERILSTWVCLRLMIIYRSQIRTWIGLAPALLLKYAFMPYWEGRNSISLEPEQITNCFYANRGRAEQKEVVLSHKKFVEDFFSGQEWRPGV
jgi:LmbE family N-acetylglucosaminyl deacetylase